MIAEIRVPTIGATVSSIGRWFKRVGDPVDRNEPVVEIEADGKTVELLASATGVLTEIHLTDGENVTAGALLGTITKYGSETKTTHAE